MCRYNNGGLIYMMESRHICHLYIWKQCLDDDCVLNKTLYTYGVNTMHSSKNYSHLKQLLDCFILC